MELIAYVKETNEVCYKCEICKKASVIDIKQNPIFSSMNEYVCTLKDDSKLICEKCGNIHDSSLPLIKNNEPVQVQCPKCHSTQIQLMKRGWKVTTGFFGSSKNIRVCLNCKHQF